MQTSTIYANNQTMMIKAQEFVANSHPHLDFLLEPLWLKAVCGNIESLENIHKLLYPAIYEYFERGANNEQMDTVIADAFVYLWKKRDSITANYILGALIDYIFQMISFLQS